MNILKPTGILLTLLIVGSKTGSPPDDGLIKRIWRGSDVTARQYPFVASLRSFFGSHYCSGTIYNDQWILTAASCVVGRGVSALGHHFITVVVGSSVLHNSFLSDGGGQKYGVSLVVPHKDYHQVGHHDVNDIALVKLEKKLEFGAKVQAVPGLGTAVKGGNLTVLGWNKDVGILQSLDVTVPDLSSLEISTVAHSRTGICTEDVGGPLVDPAKMELVGIVSHEAKSGDFKYTESGKCTEEVHFTRVDSYADWIKENIGVTDL